MRGDISRLRLVPWGYLSGDLLLRFPAHFFDLGGPSHYSGNYLIGFEHCRAHFFDLGGPSHYSGNYRIGFEHCAFEAQDSGILEISRCAS
jgi:hypothetical protein